METTQIPVYRNAKKEFNNIVELVKKFPNDQDLGEEIRKLINDYNQTPTVQLDSPNKD